MRVLLFIAFLLPSGLTAQVQQNCEVLLPEKFHHQLLWLGLEDSTTREVSVKREPPFTQSKVTLGAPLGVYRLVGKISGSKAPSSFGRDIELIAEFPTPFDLDSGFRVALQKGLRGWVLSPIDPAMTQMDIPESPAEKEFLVPAAPGAYTFHYYDPEGRLRPTGKSVFLMPGQVIDIHLP